VKNFTVYRNGSTTLTERITKALEHYAIHNVDALPSEIRVNPRDLEAAREIIRALDLPTLQVIGNGGCAAVEVWLQNPPTTNLPKSVGNSPDSGFSAQPGENSGN